MFVKNSHEDGPSPPAPYGGEKRSAIPSLPSWIQAWSTFGKQKWSTFKTRRSNWLNLPTGHKKAPCSRGPSASPLFCSMRSCLLDVREPIEQPRRVAGGTSHSVFRMPPGRRRFPGRKEYFRTGYGACKSLSHMNQRGPLSGAFTRDGSSWANDYLEAVLPGREVYIPDRGNVEVFKKGVKVERWRKSSRQLSSRPLMK